MSQLGLDLGQLDVMPAIRAVVERVGLQQTAARLGMDTGDLLHAINRTRRSGGRLKCTIRIDQILALVALPGGDEIVRLVARAAGMVAIVARPPSAEEEAISWRRVIERETGGETRKGLLRAHRREVEQLVAERELAKGSAK